MRRLLVLCAVLALVGAASADAARPPTFQWGAAHIEHGRLKGWAVVRNWGPARSTPIEAWVVMRNARHARRLGPLTVPAIAPDHRKWFRFLLGGAGAFAAGRWKIEACLAGHCRPLGQTKPDPGGGANSGGGNPGGGANGSSPAPKVPISTVPTDPITHPVAEPFFFAGGGAEYWGFVPRSYDPTNQTPTPLFIWLHGCGGEAEGDAWVVDPGAEQGVAQDWMTLSLGGRDGDCWDPPAETEPLVLAALADFETHFNVDRRRVLLGGYSSGGDLAYRTGFRHSSTFAGLLIENSSPFRDTGSTQAESLAAATTKLHIVHLAHTGDTTYPIEGVRAEVGAVRAAGFPIELIERPGSHSDSHTDEDLLAYLLPHIDDGWLAPTP
jgi:hypothetical protein